MYFVFLSNRKELLLPNISTEKNTDFWLQQKKPNKNKVKRFPRFTQQVWNDVNTFIWSLRKKHVSLRCLNRQRSAGQTGIVNIDCMFKTVGLFHDKLMRSLCLFNWTWTTAFILAIRSNSLLVQCVFMDSSWAWSVAASQWHLPPNKTQLKLKTIKYKLR